MEKWTGWLAPLVATFKWIELCEIPQWSGGEQPIDHTANMLIEKKIIGAQDSDRIFADYGNIKAFLNSQPGIFDEWNKSKVSIQKRWQFVFTHLKRSTVSYDKFAKMVEYAMMIPGNNIGIYEIQCNSFHRMFGFFIGTNSECERIFSLMQNYWTDRKSNLSLATLKAWLLTKHNLEFSCVDFHSFITSNPGILTQVSFGNFLGFLHFVMSMTLAYDLSFQVQSNDKYGASAKQHKSKDEH